MIALMAVRLFAARSCVSGPMMGMPPPYRRLEPQRRPALGGARERLRPVLGDHLLVGGDHVLARVERSLDVVERRTLPAHRLDDDVDLRGRDDGGGVPP